LEEWIDVLIRAMEYMPTGFESAYKNCYSLADCSSSLSQG